MKVNTDKSHLLVSGNVRAMAKIDNNYIEVEEEQVLLGIILPLKTVLLIFVKEHVKN